jgi:hypothetical protein
MRKILPLDSIGEQPTDLRREAGSAYIVTLLALVVLTILALALTLVTQGEVQIGGAEKTVNRLFYSTDSALSLAAPKIIFNDPAVDDFILNRTQIGSGTNSANVADRLTIGAPVPVDIYHSDKSIAAMGKEEFFQTSHTAAARAERISWKGNGLPDVTATVEGSKILTVQILIQPARKFDIRSFPGLQSNLGAIKPPPS